MATRTREDAKPHEDSGKTPAERLLDALGPVGGSFDFDAIGDFGLPARAHMEQLLEPVAKAGPSSRLGPLEKIHVFWFSGMSCDGCSVSVTGATAPSIETLLLGTHPGLPRVVLHHPVLTHESGPQYLRAAERAINGELDAPYAIVLEGSATDETVAMETGGHWAGNGEAPWGPDGQDRTVTCSEFIARMAPGAAASIAIGTCATWGGIPSSHGNPTGAMSLMDFLGKDYRSAFGLPVVNVPGCPPIGDNFNETVASILYFLQGFGPLPEFDELGRPAWLFGETVHRHCVRGAYYEEGSFAQEFGDPNCLVEIGCWGPVVNCNITSRGMVRHFGGCMNAGAPCVGCTMPGFPDKFSPRWKTPPGSKASTSASRVLGSVIKPLRMYTNEHLNREVRWDLHEDVPSGWASEKAEPGRVKELGHKLYDRLRRSDDGSRSGHDPRGKRVEWTQREEPSDDRVLPGGEER
ncbi:MAG: hydrogenase expression protein HypE [Chloroflexota bacterium]|nr:hydrogenase expression protein HypE [Chloroflexota bacterium]